MTFSKIEGEARYGKNSGLVQRLTAGPDDIEVVGGALLAIPGAIALQVGGSVGAKHLRIRFSATWVCTRQMLRPYLCGSCPRTSSPSLQGMDDVPPVIFPAFGHIGTPQSSHVPALVDLRAFRSINFSDIPAWRR